MIQWIYKLDIKFYQQTQTVKDQSNSQYLMTKPKLTDKDYPYYSSMHSLLKGSPYTQYNLHKIIHMVLTIVGVRKSSSKSLGCPQQDLIRVIDV